MQWSQQAPRSPNTTDFPQISIRLKEHEYSEKGILVNGNSFVPIDLVEQLGIQIANNPEVRQIRLFIHQIDRRLAELNQIAIDFDLSRVADVPDFQTGNLRAAPSQLNNPISVPNSNPPVSPK